MSLRCDLSISSIHLVLSGSVGRSLNSCDEGIGNSTPVPSSNSALSALLWIKLTLPWESSLGGSSSDTKLGLFAFAWPIKKSQLTLTVIGSWSFNAWAADRAQDSLVWESAVGISAESIRLMTASEGISPNKTESTMSVTWETWAIVVFGSIFK